MPVGGRRSSTGTLVHVGLALAGVLLAVHAGRLALAVPNAHADNLYNLGMVRHSGQAGWWPLLETSFVHWFFEPAPVERPEDWHRGVSLVALAALARLAGGSETVLRLPHLIWLAALWWVGWRLALAVSPPPPSPRRTLGLAVLVLALLLALQPGPQLFTGAFMDDVPAGVLAVAVLLLLVRPDPRSVRAAAAAGATAALAFWMKDMALVWGPVATGWVGLSELLGPRPDRLRRAVRLAGVCGAAFLLLAAVKVGWNLADLGEPLPRPARLGMVARNVPGVVDGEHHVWFLDPEHHIDQGRLSRAPAAELRARVVLGTRLTGLALADLAPWWVLGGLGLLVLGRTAGRGDALRLAALGAVAAATVALLGALHLLEALQLRYWLAAVVAACALGAAGLAAVWRLPTGLGPRLAVLAVAAVAVAPGVIGHGEAVAGLGRLGRYSPPAVAALAASGPGPVLLETVRGMGLWAEHPELAVVGVRAAPMAALDRPAMGRFLARYPVTVAMVDLGAEPDLVRVLLGHGFTVRQRFGSELVLEPPRPAGL